MKNTLKLLRVKAFYRKHLVYPKGKHQSCQKPEKTIKTIAIIGLPNSGKSQIFNNLTKQYTLVANYPFTTVQTKSAVCKIGNQQYEIIDTPGLHCLFIHSEEELIVRDMLFENKPDVIIQCIDSNRLKQSLNLTFDLLELEIPLVVSLNAIDETTKKGIWIDAKKLSGILGVPVVESVAISGLGTPEIKKAIAVAVNAKAPLKYGDLIEVGIKEIETILPKDVFYKRKVAVLLMLKDTYLWSCLERDHGKELLDVIRKIIGKVKVNFRGNLRWLITNKKNRWIEEIIDDVLKKNSLFLEGMSPVVGRLCRHPVWGVPILLLILSITYFLIVHVANNIALWMHDVFWLPIESKINILVTNNFFNEFLIGDYGILTMGVSNALLTVLPILSIFFLLFNVLEDVGYIPNLCVLAKRVSARVGLTGNAILPVTLAFGCKTMATLTTKCLKSKKEKFIAVYLIAFGIPCAAQMALTMSILGKLGMRATVISLFVLAALWISVGIILNKVIKTDKSGSFIQALPNIRLPDPKAVIKKTYYKLYWFLKEALPIFIIAAVLLFVVDKLGVLQIIKVVFKPVIVGFLGFPLQMVDVLILCVAKHEAAAGLLIKLIREGQLNYIQSIVAVTLTMMFVPCLANIMAMIRELKIKKALLVVLCINTTAIVVAGFLNWVLVLTIG